MNKTLHVVLIALLGLLAYSNTFHVPFQWDDRNFIAENPIVKNPGYFLEPSNARVHELYTAFRSRYVGYLTFALNYKIHGTDVTGYHIVNLAVHILNALLVYLLVTLTFRTPFLKGALLKEHSKYIALFSGLLFVSHPVQTEAVTYIFQRLASLMAFFYLLSLAAYIGSRLSTRNVFALYALSLVSAVLAMKTKENAFTLPVVITLYEFLFFKGPVKTRVLRLVPLLFTLFIIPLTLMGGDKAAAGATLTGQIAGVHGAISGKDYLFTEFRVIVTYIRLLFLPVNQNIDYAYPVFHSFFNPQVFMSFLFLLSVFSCAVYLLYRSRFTGPDLRVLAFGILWFFITLSVESSVIPIPMVIDEYRVYLPSVGAVLTITAGAFLLLRKFRSRKIQMVTASFLALIPLVLSYATYERNTVWRSNISLWEDVVRKSPLKPRGHYNLGNNYAAEGLTDKAVEQYRIAVKLRPDYAEAHYNLALTLQSRGLLDRAIEHYQTASRLRPDYAEVHNNLAIAYMSKGLFDKGIEHFQAVIELRPAHADAHYNLGNAYNLKGLTGKAIEHYRIALRLRPDFKEARNNLERILEGESARVNYPLE